MSALWALGSFLFPVTAEAEEPYFGGGVFLGWTFGDKTSFEGGVEGFGVVRLDHTPETSSESRQVGGATLQLAWRMDAPRFTLAGLAGSAGTGGRAGVTGELGATYRFGTDPGFGIHTGLMAQVMYGYAGVRRQWLLDDTWVGGGVRLPLMFGEETPKQHPTAIGRPLRTDQGVLHCASVEAWTPRDARELAAQEWQRAAQHECESVPAFLRLAEELLFHDAPDELVERALDAAEDEIRHAALSGLLARALRPGTGMPHMPVPEPRRLVRGERGLRQLATESVIDGLIGEGMAAERARLGSLQATEAVFARAQGRIHADESRHAALGGDIARWAARAGGDPVRDALADLRRHEPSGTSGTSDSSSDTDTSRYGHVSAQDASHVADRMARALPARVERLLEGS